MSGDYKWDIQMIFEDKVQELHGDLEYWDLPQEEQDRLYWLAEREYFERMADHADYSRKAEREN